MKKLIVLFVALAACTGNDKPEIVPQSYEPVVSNGRLKFPSAQAIGDFIGTFTKQQEASAALNGLRAFTRAANFKSHRDVSSVYESDMAEQAYDDIGVSINPYLDSLRLSPVIDSRLASILNEKRELEIEGGTIVRIQNDFTFLYKQNQFSALRDFYLALKEKSITPPSGTTGISFNGIMVYKTDVTINGQKSSEVVAPSNGRTQAEYLCDVRPADDQWRVYGRAYTIWSVVYASAGLESMSQTKRRKCKFLSGCWYSWDVDVNVPYLAIKYDIWIATYAPIARYTETRSGTNTSRVSHFFGEHGGVNVPAFELSGWYCTKGTHPSYGTLQCSNTFIKNYSLALTPLSCP